MPDVDINTVILTVIIGGIKWLCYYLLHVYIPNLLDHMVFNLIFDWVGDHVVTGEVPEVRDSHQNNNTAYIDGAV